MSSGGSKMDIKLHKLAKTTPVAWAYIQHPSQSGPALGHELGISLRTVYKRNAFIHRFVGNYNRTRLKCLDYQAPILALNNYAKLYARDMAIIFTGMRHLSH